MLHLHAWFLNEDAKPLIPNTHAHIWARSHIEKRVDWQTGKRQNQKPTKYIQSKEKKIPHTIPYS